MARNAKTEKPLTAEEQRLVRHYVREGGTEDRIPAAARKTRISVERATRLLRLTHVQLEVTARKQLLMFEQARLDAMDLNRRESEADEHVRVAEKKIYREFNNLIETPAEKLGDGHRIKAQILKLALVVTGTIRDGRTERLIPPDQQPGQSGPNIYRSVFEQQAQKAAAVEDEAAELYPEPEGQQASESASQPAPAARAPEPEKVHVTEDVKSGPVLEVPVRRKQR